MRLLLITPLVTLLLALSLPAGAQQRARPVRLLITVVDSTGGTLPGTTVKLTGLEDATKRTAVPPAKTDERGVATFENLAPGHYSVEAAFAGFQTGIIRSVATVPGDTKQTMTLALQGVAESVTATAGPDEASSRSASSFGVSMTAEEIAALPDDPNQLQQQIMDLAGPDAIMRVDSFEGQQLPPKSQIKSIHVTRDSFAAETEQPGSTYVDVITQPGSGALSGGGGYTYQEGMLNGRDVFVREKGPAANRNYNGNLGGTIAKGRSDFSLSINGQNSFSTPISNQTGTGAQLLGLKQPTDYVSFSGLVNYALTRDQTIRLGFSQYRETDKNQGIGVFDSADRAYAGEYRGLQFRAQEAGPIGRRAFINTRLSVGDSSNSQQSAVEQPTIIILDGSTKGGAQQAGGTRSRNFTVGSDIDYIRGINSWRAGVQVNGGSYTSDANSNYLGTYTFSSQSAFDAGTPLQYTRSIGDPLVHYFNAQGAVYLQDDLRVRKNLTVSPGVRYSVQTHVHDMGGAAPRFGVTWSPGTSGNDVAAGERRPVHRLALDGAAGADHSQRRPASASDPRAQPDVSGPRHRHGPHPGERST